jgi:hypothetical protein
MKTWTVTCFGRQIVKVEMREEASIADVVRHLVAQRLGVEDHEIEVEESEYADLADGLIPCESCGEMFDPDEDDLEDEVNARFADMTERLLWGRQQDDPTDDDDETH